MPTESPFESWSRRLLFGPVPLIQQELQRRGQQESDEAAGARSRENILLNIREQARANQETEQRKQEAESTRLQGLMGVLNKPKSSLPAVGVMQGAGGAEPISVPMTPRRPPLEEVLPHLSPGKREEAVLREYTPEKPEGVKGIAPTEDVYVGTTRVKQGTPKPAKPWWENYNILGEGMAETAALERKGQLAESGQGPALTREESEKLAILQGAIGKYTTTAGGLAGIKAGEGERARFAQEQTQPIGDKASQYVHPAKYMTPSPAEPRGEVEKTYRHIPNASNPGRGVMTVWGLLSKATDIVERRNDLFFPLTGSTASDIGQRTKAELAWRAKGLAGDPDIAELKALLAAIPQMVRSFGDTGNIAFSERQMTTEATGLEGPNSKVAALSALQVLLDLTNGGMGFYGMDPLKIPRLEKALAGLKVRDGVGRPIPGGIKKP